MKDLRVLGSSPSNSLGDMPSRTTTQPSADPDGRLCAPSPSPPGSTMTTTTTTTTGSCVYVEGWVLVSKL
ncbi:hypothetical protein LY76DRAFT_7726 [Colletotrichum caudatum]|nr:hypothetical protein LY76DRAFT_7726 [Colletotrichum caudatum]